MKRYEDVTRLRLVPRMPVIVRVDGKAFHTLTRHMDKPFDETFQRCMWETAGALCRSVQGARLAYVQSDEISVLLIDYESLDTSGWFNQDLRKIVSVSASIATAAFAKGSDAPAPGYYGPALFDSRAWNIPREEVCNYFIWRQQDAVRNSIQGLAYAHFSQKQLHGLSCDVMQEKLFQEKGINWNDSPAVQKRGACWVWVPAGPIHSDDRERRRHEWTLDLVPPTFTRDRPYVERFVYPDDAPATPSTPINPEPIKATG